MQTPPLTRRTIAAASAVLLVVLVAGYTAMARPGNAATIRSAAAQHGPSKHTLLHPKQKYYGVFAPPAPASMTPLTQIKEETGKKPNLVLWYQSWGADAAKGTANFYAAAAKQACSAGVLPMFTWESWNTSDKSGQVTKIDQPAFSTERIINGKYDKYIRNTAKAIKAIGCPIAVRLDQEFNGNWYPWGLATKGMGSGKDTPKRYVKMWRHVWTIFHNEHVTNVLWVWSPNYIGHPPKGTPKLSASYPGSKYVDWVAMDGYYVTKLPHQTFSKLFGKTLTQFKTFASGKPWLVAETGVGSNSRKPQLIANLVHNIAERKQFNGFVYFDATAVRADWRFQATQASLAAFKKAISSKTFGAAKPGSL